MDSRPALLTLDRDPQTGTLGMERVPGAPSGCRGRSSAGQSGRLLAGQTCAPLNSSELTSRLLDLQTGAHRWSGCPKAGWRVVVPAIRELSGKEQRA